MRDASAGRGTIKGCGGVINVGDSMWGAPLPGPLPPSEASLRHAKRSFARGEREHYGRHAWLDAPQTKMPGAWPGIKVRTELLAQLSTKLRSMRGHDGCFSAAALVTPA